MEQNEKLQQYVEMPVLRAIMENALPAMAAMLMVLIYNLADTFFIGRTNDPYQVAAISICSPVFLFTVAFGTVFGVGGTSLISRVLGEGKPEKAKKICSFCFWGGLGSGLLLAAIIFIFADGLLTVMGASEMSFDYAKTYLLIIASCCPLSVVANSYNNILRSEGRSKEAMGGQLIGNLVNIVLDPLFISVFDMGIMGAAVATVIGNVIGAIYYIGFFLSGKSTLSINPKDFASNDGIASGVLAIGIPAALGSFLMSTAQLIANSLMMEYGDMAVAGYGVSGKISMITGAFCIGLGQGVSPLIGYCVGSENRKRFKELVTASMIMSLCLGALLAGLVLIFRKPMVAAFLSDPEASQYAVTFITILMSTGCLFGIFYVMSSILQAMGKGLASLVTSLSRQGLVFIPALFILSKVIGTNGIVWAQPLADVLSTVFSAIICFTVMGRFIKNEAK